jgi:RHS repeat-associated protein
MVEEIGTTTTAYHFQYDGNGNVTEITDHTGASAATYRYDAFGNTLVATGSYAATNRYRFSTKPLDDEIANALLYYYAYRYYDPMTGRWPSRDPIGERGGMNLYAFVKNMTITYIDVNGLKEYNSNSQNAQERNRQEKINIQTKHNGVSNRANKGAATLDEAASAAGNKATAAGSLPDEVIKWGNIISSEAQRREADEKCKKSAEIIFQFENHFFGPKKVCKLCCVYSGILNEAGWFYSTHRIVRGSCDDIRKDEYEKFENTDYIGDPADTVTIGFIDFTNPLK